MSEDRSQFQEATNMDIMRAVGRLEGKVDGMADHVAKQNSSILELYKKSEKHSEQISNLRVRIGTIGAFVGAAVSMAGNWIWSKLMGGRP